MKTIILILLSINATAQITVATTTQAIIGEIRKLGFPVATLTQSITGTDTSYNIRYRDMQNWDADKYYNIPFKATLTELGLLHKAMASVHDPQNAKNKSYAIVITLGNTTTTIKNYTYMGVVMTEILTPDGYFQLTKGQVNKLFGK